MMRPVCSLAILGILGGPLLGAEAPPTTAAEIMRRVAANQERAESERAHYVYVQHARVASLKGKRLLCEEVTDSRVLPQSSGSDREFLRFEGKFWQRNHYVPYGRLLSNTHVKSDDAVNVEVVETENENTDVGLVESLREGLMSRDSKDGLAAGLFPLTSKAQSSYDYRLVGRERMNGRETFHIAFAPKATGDYGWMGDAWIDSEAFQPVLVRTRLSRNMPFLVKTMLGTNIPGLGFAVTYAPQPDGTWFPTSFGTEFKIHVLFFFSRQITMSAVNNGFEKTHVESRIVSGSPVASSSVAEPVPAKPDQP